MSKKWIGIAMTGSLILGACGMGTQTPTKPVDNIKPTVALNLAAGTIVAGKQLLIVDAADAGGIAEVQVVKDGKLLSTLKNAPYSMTIDTTDSIGKDITLTAVAKDKAGNTAQSTLTVKVVQEQFVDPGTNNSKETAVVLHPGQKVVGATTAAADTAWYKFEVDGSSAPNRFEVTPVSPVGSKLDLVLTLYKEEVVDGQAKLVVVDESDSGAAGEYDPPIAATSTGKTTYYAVIKGYAATSGDYTLKLDVFGQVGDVTGSVLPATLTSNVASREFVAEGQPFSKKDLVQSNREVRYIPGRVLAILNARSSKAQPGIEISAAAKATFVSKAEDLASSYGMTLESVPSVALGYVVLKGQESDISKTLQAMSRDARIKYASPDYLQYEAATPPETVVPSANGNVLASYTGRFSNDPFLNDFWGLKLINAPQAWTATTGNMSTVVAVLDSGIAGKIGDTTMNRIPDLIPNLIPGYDFMSAETVSDFGVSIPAALLERFPNLKYLDRDSHPGPDPYPIQEIDTNKANNALTTSNGHGTHVAGTIGAVGNNRIGGAGVAWDVRLQPIRVLNSGIGGASSDILNGALYAAGYEVTYEDAEGKEVTVVNPTPAKVINMSLGGGAYSPVAEEIYTSITNEANVLVIAAAGNNSSGEPSYPASYASVMSVSSVDFILDSDGDPTNGYQSRPAFSADFSNYGPDIDVAAPGGSCWYTSKDYKDYNDVGFPSKPSGLCYLPGDVNSKYDYSSVFVLSTNLRNNYPTSGVLDASTVYNPAPIYNYSAGTSMATPHVAGVAALMYSLNPNLTAYQARQILRQTAKRIDDTDLKGNSPVAFGQGNGKINERRDDFYGFGLVDAAAALEAVMGNKLPKAVPASAQAYAVLMAGNEVRAHQMINKEQFAAKFFNQPRGEYKLIFALDNNNNRILAEKGEWIYTANVTIKAGEVVQASGTFTEADGKNPITLPAEQPK